MGQISHVVKVIFTIMYRVTLFWLKVALSLAALLSAVYLCIKLETAGKVVFAIIVFGLCLTLILLFAFYVWDVSDSIKRKSK